MAADFDPDAYLAGGGGGDFDPDQWLRDTASSDHSGEGQVEPEGMAGVIRSVKQAAKNFVHGYQEPEAPRYTGSPLVDIGKSALNLGERVLRGGLEGIRGGAEQMGRESQMQNPEQFGRDIAGMAEMEGMRMGPEGMGAASAPAEALGQMAREARASAATGTNRPFPGQVPQPPPSTPTSRVLDRATAEEAPGAAPGEAPPAEGAPGNQPYGRPSAGAAGGPNAFESASPETQKKVQEAFDRSGYNEHSIEDEIERMHPEETLGEVNEDMRGHLRGLYSEPGQQRTEIANTIRGRDKEYPARATANLDQAFGEGRDVEAWKKEVRQRRKEEADPLWRQFEQTQITPTPELEALDSRLRAAGAMQAANRNLRVEGKDVTHGFPEGEAPERQTQLPTAEAYQYAKEHLDDDISAARRGGRDGEARRLTILKHDLVDAIDNHPDANIAGVWKAARDAWAGPTRELKAQEWGRNVLTNAVSPEEVAERWTEMSPRNRDAAFIGIRDALGDMEGGKGTTGRRMANIESAILSPDNQLKLRRMLGDDKAGNLIRAFEGEQRMRQVGPRIIGNSETAPTKEFHDYWFPEQPNMLERAAQVAGAVAHPKVALAKAVGRQLDTRAEARTRRIAEETGRILTTTGAERDAILRRLAGGPETPPPRPAPGRGPGPPPTPTAPSGPARTPGEPGVEAASPPTAAPPLTAAEKASVERLIAAKASPGRIEMHPVIRRAYEEANAYPPTNEMQGAMKDGKWTPEWIANRPLDTPDGPVKGWEAGRDYLEKQAESFAGGPVKAQRRATIVIGPGGAGKSTLMEPLAKARGASIIDADEAKKIVPEFRGGIGATAVHEESSSLMYGGEGNSVLKRQAEKGNNLVIQKIGHNPESIRKLTDYLRSHGYSDFDLIHLKVDPEEAFRRRIYRFLNTTRINGKGYHESLAENGAAPDLSYRTLKNEGHFGETLSVDANGPFGQPKPILEGHGTNLAKDSGVETQQSEHGLRGRQGPGQPDRAEGERAGSTTRRLTRALEIQKSGYKQPLDPAGESYVTQAMANLAGTSRTATGAGKAEKGAAGAGAASRSQSNFEQTFRDLYAQTAADELPTSGHEMRYFLNGIAARVNEGINTTGTLLRKHDTGHGQTPPAQLGTALQKFANEFGERLRDPNADPVTTAAWVEWQANMVDHFWSDGVGRTTRAIAAIPLMKAGEPLPRYPGNKEFYRFSPERGGTFDKFNEAYHGWVDQARSAPDPKGIAAYHGSPHDFDKFDISRIGTGEGAQAYGHGLYFAENEGTAKSYRDVLSGGTRIPGAPIGRSKYMVGDVDVPQGMSGHRALDTSNELDLLLGTMKDNPDSSMIPYLKQNIQNRIARWSSERDAAIAHGYGGGSADADMQALADFYNQHVKNAAPGSVKEKPPGRIYQVSIKADPEHFLDWDKPLSEHPRAQEALRPILGDGNYHTDKALMMANKHLRAAGDPRTAEDVLRAAGIPGIKYLDQGSRKTADLLDLKRALAYWQENLDAPEAAQRIKEVQQAIKEEEAKPVTHNYVVFDDKLVDIVKKYGLAGLVAAGAYHYQDKALERKKRADGGRITGDMPVPVPETFGERLAAYGSDEQGNVEDRRNEPLWLASARFPHNDPAPARTATSAAKPRRDAGGSVSFAPYAVLGASPWSQPGQLAATGQSGGIAGNTTITPAFAAPTSSIGNAKTTTALANRGGAILANRAKYHYAPDRGTRAAHCGNCSMFRAPHKCTAVGGWIVKAGKCDIWELAARPHRDAGGGVQYPSGTVTPPPVPMAQPLNNPGMIFSPPTPPPGQLVQNTTASSPPTPWQAPTPTPGPAPAPTPAPQQATPDAQLLAQDPSKARIIATAAMMLNGGQLARGGRALGRA